jgi:hypothetical protein
LELDFARLWCGQCRRSVLVAFSCHGRSFCTSCEKKKAAAAPWSAKTFTNEGLGDTRSVPRQVRNDKRV